MDSQRKQKLYRCRSQKCQEATQGRGREFQANPAQGESPVCPECGLDPKGNPRLADLIQRLVLVHFDAPTSERGIGVNTRACDPNKPIQVPQGDRAGPANSDHAGTGHPEAVSCPRCKETEAYKTALKALHGDDEEGD